MRACVRRRTGVGDNRASLTRVAGEEAAATSADAFDPAAMMGRFVPLQRPLQYSANWIMGNGQIRRHFGGAHLAGGK